MKLSPAAKLYLTWQVFDHVNRMPTRISALSSGIEGLAAWPDFRVAILEDPRFLAVDDWLDVASVGLSATSPVERIIAATLDRARVPMRERDLEYMVRRFRKNLPAHADLLGPIRMSPHFFRPRTGHLARRRWLEGAEPLDQAPADLPDDPLEAAEACLEHFGRPLPANRLAATLSRKFGMPMEEAYGIAVDPTFLPLPDGTVCLYLSVEDEITAAVEALKDAGKQPPADQGAAEKTVALKDLEEGSAPVSREIATTVAHLCRKDRRPISTATVVEVVVGVPEDDPRYLMTYWTVHRHLGLSPELMSVGDHLWMDTASVPGDVFRHLIKRPKSSQPDETPKPTSPDANRQPDSAQTISLWLSEEELSAGCLQSPRLAGLFPGGTLVQVVLVNGAPAWYNAETCTLVGLTNWFDQLEAAEGDVILLRAGSDGLEALLRPSAQRPSRGPARVREKPRPARNLYSAVVHVLTRAGGTLTREELLYILRETDATIEWAEVEPLFARYPSLTLIYDTCMLVTSKGRPQGGATRFEVLTSLELLGGHREHLRTDPTILELVSAVAGAPRLSAEQEAALLALAKPQLAGANVEGGAEALEELVAAHRRMVVRHLLTQRDLEELLPVLEDLFQEACRSMLRAIEVFDPHRFPRLSGAISWWVFQAINRAKADLLSPLRLPAHMYERVEAAATHQRRSNEQSTDQTAEAILDRRFFPIEEYLNAYEAGALHIEPLTLAAPDPQPGEALEEQERRRTIGLVLASLTPRESQVLKLRFGLDDDRSRTLEEVGQCFGRTRERIRQIEDKALRRLRHPSRIRILREVR